MLDVKIIEKIVDLLKSEQEELCSLAGAMFNSEKYEDYFVIRTLYDPESILLSKGPACDTLMLIWGKVKNDATTEKCKSLIEKYKSLINKTKTNGTQK